MGFKMKFTQMGFVYLMFSVLLVILGIWDLIMIKPVTYDVIATSIVLIVIGATLGVSLFVQSWVKAAIFVDGLVFIATGITFLMAPYNYVFILFGVILLVIAVLAYMRRLPNFLLRLFYKN